MEEPMGLFRGTFSQTENPFGLPVFTPTFSAPAKDGRCHLSGVVRCGGEMIFRSEGRKSGSNPWWCESLAFGKKTMVHVGYLFLTYPAFLGYIFTCRLYTAHLYRYPFKLKVSRHLLFNLSQLLVLLVFVWGKKNRIFHSKLPTFVFCEQIV